MNGFAGYHPIVNLIYFAVTIGFTMFFMNPVCLFISFFCSFVYSVVLGGRKALKTNFLYMLPMMLAMALMNPLFNHEGVTVIRYMHNGNPLTAESIIYGLFASLMIISVILWFFCYNKVMTSDKFIYLFGRIIPALSLIFSMTLGFVPRFAAQIKKVSDARKCMGRNASCGGVFKRIKCALDTLSVVVTWSLENAIETSDSMRSRGYGLPGRTAFSIYSFGSKDVRAIILIVATAVCVSVCGVMGGLYFRYFPSIKWAQPSVFGICGYISYFVLCIYPVLIEIEEVRRWRALKSKS